MLLQMAMRVACVSTLIRAELARALLSATKRVLASFRVGVHNALANPCYLGRYARTGKFCAYALYNSACTPERLLDSLIE